MNKKQISMYLAEAVGTFILASIAHRIGGEGLVGVLIVGLTLAVMVGVIGPISGSHINPAVTLSLLSQGKIKVGDAAGYIIAQGLGGLAAWQVFDYMKDVETINTARDFAGTVLVAEAIGMAIFTFGIAAAVHGKYKGIHQALIIGLSLMLGVIVASATTGAGILNPAVALSLRDFQLDTLLGPIIGGVMGMALYNTLAENADI